MAASPPVSFTESTIGSFMMKQVRTIDVTKPMSECVKLMEEHNIGSVIVVDHESPVGIFTERDLVKMIAGKKELNLKMSQVMSKPLTTISSTATLWDAISLMGRANIRRLPVVEKGKLVGIFTERDLFRLIIQRQNLILESVAEYLPAMTREQLKELVSQLGTERPPTPMPQRTNS
ncbi:MAG TPA: CBS domain-containing protein [Nitrososphaerales archaeon]|nr:CBS domain-containing protein [Nitrososphaerales archaeon]